MVPNRDMGIAAGEVRDHANGDDGLYSNNHDGSQAMDRSLDTLPAGGANNEDIEMDDTELDAMVVELGAEPSVHASLNPSSSFDLDIDDEDLGDMARELEDEAMRGVSADTAPVAREPISATPPSVTTHKGGIMPSMPSIPAIPSMPTMPSMPPMPSMLSSSIAAAGLTAGIRQNQAPRGPSFSRTSFPTKTATARNAFSGAASKTIDHFNTVLGAGAGDRWRRVVRGDEKRMASAVYGPLSRAYKGDNSDVRPLSVESATAMALEDAKAVSLEAKLPADVEARLVWAIKENGALYLREVEQTVRARLATDPDFDPNIFPATARRFAS